ncbi:MAG: hypothetical protein ACYSUI_17785 [Planctomycetota bacterium]
MLHVIALGQYTVAYTRSWVVNGWIARVRLKAKNGGLRQQVPYGHNPHVSPCAR